MKNLSTRAMVVGALFAGATFGSMSTGCFAIWLGAARADGATPAQGQVITVSCSTKGSDGNTYAVASFPGFSKQDLAANVYVALLPDGPANPAEGPVTVGGTSYVSGILAAPRGVADGSVAVHCADGATSVQIYVRQ